MTLPSGSRTSTVHPATWQTFSKVDSFIPTPERQDRTVLVVTPIASASLPIPCSFLSGIRARATCGPKDASGASLGLTDGLGALGDGKGAGMALAATGAPEKGLHHFRSAKDRHHVIFVQQEHAPVLVYRQPAERFVHDPYTGLQGRIYQDEVAFLVPFTGADGDDFSLLAGLGLEPVFEQENGAVGVMFLDLDLAAEEFASEWAINHMPQSRELH